MNDVLKFGKKLFTFSVVAMTLVWSLGVSALVATPAHAEGECPTVESGDLVKVGSSATVYAINDDLRRQVIPDEPVFYSWYKDFSTVKTIPETCLAQFPLAQISLTFRPGSALVKSQEATAVYLILPGGEIAHIDNEAVARGLYGSQWNKSLLHTLPDSKLSAYVDNGKKITEPVLQNGMLVMKEGTTAAYYVMDGMLHPVDGTLSKITSPALHAVSAEVFASVEMSADSVTEATIITRTGTQPAPVTQTTLKASLSASTPTSATLPKSATNVDVLKVNLMAGSSSLTVDEVTVKRGGAGLTTGLTAYLYDGDVRLGSSGRTFSSDTNEAEFTSLGFTIPANTTKVLTVRLQTGSTAGEHDFAVTAINAGSNVTVSGLPVSGNTFSVSSAVTAGTLAVDGVGTLAAPTVGDANVELAEFKLTPASEDQMLKTITLKQDGTITTSNLSNFKLYQGTTEVPVMASLDGRYLTLSLTSDYKLVDGSGKTFTLKGDISSNAEVGDTIVFYMNNASDIKAVGTSYGYGALANIGDYDEASDSQTLTLLGGSLTISNLSASAHDVKTDSTEVELGKVAMKAVSDTMEIQKMTVSITTPTHVVDTHDYGIFKDDNNGGAYAADETLLLRNIKLKDADTGKTLGSSKSVTDCGLAVGEDVDETLSCVWTDYFTINKGTTRNVVVVADIYSSQVSGVVHKATFDFSGSNVIVKDSQDNTVTDIVPAATVSSYNVTTRSSSLTITRSITPETRTVVKGSTVDALGLILAAGSGEGNDVKVSGLNVNVYVDSVDTTDGTFVDTTESTLDANELVTQVSLYEGDTLVAGPVSVNTSGNAVFSSSKFVGGYYTVPAGTNKNLVLKAVVSGNAPYDTASDGVNDNRFAFTFAAGDVTAEDANGEVTAEVTGTNVNGGATPTSPDMYIQVTGNGTITVAAGADKPSARVLVAKAGVEQEVHRVRLTATKEDFTVDELTVTVSSTIALDDVVSARLYDTDGTALSTSQTPDGSGNVNFTGLSINVPKNGGTTVVVKAILNTMGERTVATNATAGVGADAGDPVQFVVSTSSGDFHAVGTSGYTDSAADAALGNTMTVRNSLVTVAVSDPSSTSLLNGQRTLMRFSVTADVNADVILGAISPYISFSDSDGQNELYMSSSSLYLYDVTGAEQLLNATGANPTHTSSTGYFDINVDSAYLSSNAKITAGATKTYEIRATFAGVESSDSVEVQLKQDVSAMTSGTVTYNTSNLSDAQGNTGNTASFIWSDTGADTNGASSVEWTNSYGLFGWPTKVVTLSKS